MILANNVAASFPDAMSGGERTGQVVAVGRRRPTLAGHSGEATPTRRGNT